MLKVSVVVKRQRFNGSVITRRLLMAKFVQVPITPTYCCYTLLFPLTEWRKLHIT